MKEVTMVVTMALPDVQGELHGAVGAEIRAGAVAGVLHALHGLVGGQWDEAEAERRNSV